MIAAIDSLQIYRLIQSRCSAANRTRHLLCPALFRPHVQSSFICYTKASMNRASALRKKSNQGFAGFPEGADGALSASSLLPCQGQYLQLASTFSLPTGQNLGGISAITGRRQV